MMMKKIRDIEEYYDEDDEEQRRIRHFRKDKDKRESEHKRKWDREDHYRRPQDYDDY